MDDRRRDRGAAVAAAVGRWIRPTIRDLALADYAAVALDAVDSPEIRVAATELLDDPRPAELLYRSCVDNAERILTGAGITSVGVNWRGRPIPLDRDPVQVVLAQTGAALVTMLAVATAAVLVVLRAPVSVPGLVTVPAVVLAVVVALAVRARVVRLLTRLGRADGTRWRTRVREEAVLPYLREYLNRRATDGQVLALRHVPGLGAADGMSRVVDRRVIDTTRELVNDLDSGAIAVAGSRGAGKTTLLRVLCSPEYASPGSPDLRVLVSAPVDYDARDFLIHVYLRLCETVRDLAGRRRRLRIVPALSVLAGLALVGWQLGWPEVAPPRPTVREGLLALGVALVAAGLGYRRLVRRRADDRGRSLAERARHRLEQLRYVRTYTTGHSAGASGGGLEWARSTGRQLAEQPLTLPELVASYREFVEAATAWWRRRNPTGRLVVGIDEVDRIADPAKVERFVNDLKAMFGTRDCVYLVTVSDEALSSVEGRARGARTALDSTFEELVRVPAMDLPTAVALVQRRVVGLPYPFLLLCHCLAAGLPRELIRVARRIVAARRETRRNELAAIARHVLLADARAAHASLLSPFAAVPGADALLALPDGAAGPADVLRGLRTDEPELAAAVDRLDAGWRVTATLLDVFGRRAGEVAALFAAPPETPPPADPWLSALRPYEAGEGRIGFSYNGIRYEQDASGGYVGVDEAESGPPPPPPDPRTALLPAIGELFEPLVAARDAAWRQPDRARDALARFTDRAGSGALRVEPRSVGTQGKREGPPVVLPVP